jgi:hypothetical protein
MSSEADALAAQQKKDELKAFVDARKNLQSKSQEFTAEAEDQLSELKKRTIEGFRDL